MAGSDLQAALGFQTLTARVSTFFDQEKQRRFLSEVFKRRVPILGAGESALAVWYEITSSRELAPFVGEDDEAKEQQKLGVTKRKASPAHIKLSKRLTANELFREGWPDDKRIGDGLQLLPNAKQRIDDELRSLNNNLLNSIEWLCAQALTGTITINSTNVPGTTIPATVTFTNVQTLTAGGAYWSAAATKIVNDTTSGKPSIFNMKRSMQDNAGVALRRIYHNATQTAQLRMNTEIQNLLRGSIPNAPVVGTLEQINLAVGGEGIRFIEHDGTYTKTSTVTRYIADSTVLCLCDDDQYFELQETYQAIPSGQQAGIIGAPGGELNLIRLSQPGAVAYAVLNPKPPISIELFLLWSGLPVLKYPKCVLNATVN